MLFIASKITLLKLFGGLLSSRNCLANFFFLQKMRSLFLTIIALLKMLFLTEITLLKAKIYELATQASFIGYFSYFAQSLASKFQTTRSF